MHLDAELKSEMRIKPEELSLSLESFIRSYMEKLEREGTILGLSGGIDSAVVAVLSKKAIGSERTLALVMPERDSKEENVKDALDFARELGIEARLIDITSHLKRLGIYGSVPLDSFSLLQDLKGILVRKAYIFYERKTGETPFSSSIVGSKDKWFSFYLKKSNARYRAKHRLRMLLLYLYGELENRLVVGAANKSEYKIGFFVKHGCDHAVDIMPLLNLYKTQVRELAGYLNIPTRIMDKPPSPDIIPGIVDEEAIGIPYEELDLVLLALEKGWKNAEIAIKLGVGEERVVCVRDMVEKAEHMRRIYAPGNI